MKRLKYTRRFVNVQLTGGKRKVSIRRMPRRWWQTDFAFRLHTQRDAATDSATDEPQPHLVSAHRVLRRDKLVMDRRRYDVDQRAGL